MKPQAMLSRALLCLIVIVAFLLASTACRPQETELSFETIEQINDPGSIKQWDRQEPKLIIITSSQDVGDAAPFVTDEAVAALQNMDFTTRFAVLAFRGLQGSSHSGFKIERIIRRDNEVILYAQPGDIGGQPQLSSPYHLIEVKKEGKWDADFTFNLYLGQDGGAATSTVVRIP